MGYPTKVQLIARAKGSDQYYINFPSAVAEAMDFQKGEIIEWTIVDKSTLVVQRREVPPHPIDLKKKRNTSDGSMG